MSDAADARTLSSAPMSASANATSSYSSDPLSSASYRSNIARAVSVLSSSNFGLVERAIFVSSSHGLACACGDSGAPREGDRSRRRDCLCIGEDARAPPTSRPLRAIPYKAKTGWCSTASVEVERRRGRGLKARGGRRETTGKILKDRRSPRHRGRMGTSV
eukprot:31215-Pelagococcus_subviridis.AAC.2